MGKVIHYKKAGYQRKMNKQERQSVFFAMVSSRNLSELRKSWRARKGLV